ncbi:MAG: DegT/DnrJ/EryC1/StrS family aminotransferase [Phaeospirillum sp.]|nr:DegT/DnrJ/EryC1/StrS family aminotransferase [Phaeospirillum sp.]
MITTAPLPEWPHLLRAAAAGRTEPVSPWLRPLDEGWLTARSCWALAALIRAVARRIGLPPRVLLPGWICNQSLWPLRQAGAELVFQPVFADGRADWAAAERLGTMDVVVVVHTFGYAVEMDAARDFANRRGALLIEDAAHVLMPGPGIGESGDAVVYSPHKLLAAPEVGVLVLRPRAEDWSAEISQSLGTPPAVAPAHRWLIRRLIQKLIPDSLRSRLPQGGQGAFLIDPETVPLPPAVAPSDLARRLLASADLPHEAARRRDNAAALRDVVKATSDLRPLFHSDTAIPYRLALRCASSKAAAERYAALRRAHLPVESWPDLPPEVTRDPIHAEGAVALRRSVLLLPVYGALSPDRLAAAYAKVLR